MSADLEGWFKPLHEGISRKKQAHLCSLRLFLWWTLFLRVCELNVMQQGNMKNGGLKIEQDCDM